MVFPFRTTKQSQSCQARYEPESTGDWRTGAIIANMVTDMNVSQVLTLVQVRELLAGTAALKFQRAQDDTGRHGFYPVPDGRPGFIPHRVFAPGRSGWPQRAVSRQPAPLAEGGTAVETMRQALETQPGRGIYARRKCKVEPVIGILKSVPGFRQFLLRGLDKVIGELDLVALA